MMFTAQRRLLHAGGAQICPRGETDIVANVDVYNFARGPWPVATVATGHFACPVSSRLSPSVIMFSVQ